MEKRLFLAVLISIALLWLWGALVPRLFPELARRPEETAQPVSTPSTAPSIPDTLEPPQIAVAEPSEQPALAEPEPAVPVAEAEQQRFHTIETDEYTARFTNAGAQLVSFKLKQHRTKDGRGLVDLVKDRPSGRHDYPFAIQSGEPALDRRLNQALYLAEESVDGSIRRLELRHVGPDGVGMVKTFRLGPGYQFDFSTRLIGRATPHRVVVGPGIRNAEAGEQESQFVISGNGVAQREGSLKVIKREKTKQVQLFEPPLDFIGLEDNYFLVALRPQVAGNGVLRPIQIPAGEEEKERIELYAGLEAREGRVEGKAYFGPKQADILEAYGLEKTLQFGAFGLIARFLLRALIWIYTLTNNWGWAIIVLTIIIKILLYPLQHKSIVSMKRMQKLQPKVNALRDKFKKAKTDPEQRQKLNTEMMKLYKQEGVNPMSGCLPILLQLPILWAFYTLLSHSIELRNATFILWITDLSAKDPYYITPILMTITMFIQQWITPTTVDPMQKRIFMAMPFIFGWIFKEFPSGLVLYWLVQNILTIAQQMIMNKWWKDHPAELK